MPLDYYPQRTEVELLALLDSLQRRQTIGVVSQASSAGMQQIKTWAGANRPEVEIKRVMYSLHVRNSIYPDPYALSVHRTRTRYTFS